MCVLDNWNRRECVIVLVFGGFGELSALRLMGA